MKPTWTSVSFLLLCTLPILGAAQVPDSTHWLDTVSIATRWDGRAQNIGQSRTEWSSKEMRSLGAATLYDAIEAMPGLHSTTAGMGFKVYNARGFANTTNVRFVQLADGVDNQSPHIGSPIGNALGAHELDVAWVELLPGAAASLHGINATNGVLNIHTRSPFEEPGISLLQRSGLNHVGDGTRPRYWNQTDLRLASRLGSRWALKFCGGYSAGEDFVADDNNDLASQANASVGLTGTDNPAYDGVNSYGNEGSNRRLLSLNGKQYAVARTGYTEAQVADYALSNYKGQVSLHFRPKAGHELALVSQSALLNNTYQRSNRFRLQDYLLLQQQISYTSRAWQAKAYWTAENTGQSYNLRSLAENMDRSHLSDNDWYAAYTAAFNGALGNGATVADAHRAARASADQGRLVPGSAAFESEKATLTTINDWDKGAALRVRAHLLHGEAQVIWTELLPMGRGPKGFELRTAIDHRSYLIVPDGNYFINPVEGGKTLQYGKTGGLLLARQKFLGQRLLLSAGLRADKCDYYGWKWNPRLSANYQASQPWSLRASFQSGYRFPSIFEGFSNVNSGGVKRVGGLPVMSEGIFENSYTKASIDAFQKAVQTAVNGSGISLDSAILTHASLLQANPYTYLQPEHVQSLEAGGQVRLLRNRLQIDAEAYANRYRDFIAQMEASVPLASDPDSIPWALFDKVQQQRYRLWTNSLTRVWTYGATLSIRLKVGRHLGLQGSMATAAIVRAEQTDGLEDGFNTPPLMGNLSLTGSELAKHWGFSLSGRWQSSYEYVSFLVSGTTPSYWTLDAAADYTLGHKGLIFKLAASNLLNRPYRAMLGGPTIRGVYTISATWALPWAPSK